MHLSREKTAACAFGRAGPRRQATTVPLAERGTLSRCLLFFRCYPRLPSCLATKGVKAQSRSTMQFGRTFNQRAMALSLATTLTFGPLLSLHFGRLPGTTEKAPERISYLSLLPTPSAPDVLAKPPTEEKATRLVGSPKSTKATASPDQSMASAPETSPSDTVQAISAAKAEATERPELPASAPVEFDSATVRAAVRAARSDARKLAESSGTYFGDEPSSRSAKLADAIARTAKEDCIGPNPGGSLLSVFDIAFKAAIGKCK
jgi:type IV secretory pathway VirB10-like protein